MMNYKKYYNNLYTFLQDDENADIDDHNLFNELKFLSHIIEENSSPLDCLKKISKEKIDHAYPNKYLALRIMLTAPVSVASAECSFTNKTLCLCNYLIVYIEEINNSLNELIKLCSCIISSFLGKGPA